MARVIDIYNKLSRYPMGKWLFSRLVCLQAPYFGSIRPGFDALEPGRCVVHFPNRRAVQNHIGTVHAIAMCNAAEIAAGTLTEVSVPDNIRWIPKGMTVQYLAKAETDLTAIATLDLNEVCKDASELPVSVVIEDANHETVMTATIGMWLTMKKRKSDRSEP